MSAHCLMIASAKGGVGKTTLAGGLAVAAVKAGRRVALIDLDPLESLSRWWELRPDSETLRLVAGVSDIPEAIELLGADGWDLVIIDTPPAPLSIALDAMRSADLVLVPCRPSSLDVDAVTVTKEMSDRLRKRAVFVLTQTQPGSRLTAASRKSLSSEKAVVLDQTISLDESYATAMARGATPAEVGRGTCADEMDAVWREVERLLKRKSAGRQ